MSRKKVAAILLAVAAFLGTLHEILTTEEMLDDSAFVVDDE